MNVSLGKLWEQYVSDQVDSGLFNNASEVVRDALRRQQEQLVKLEALRNEVQRGVDSIKAGRVSRATVDDIIRKAEARKRYVSGFILSFDADDDLQNIYNFSVARFGRDQARRYLSGLYETLDRIADYPEIGRRRPELGTEIRMLTHRSHVVFFIPWKNAVGIARVLHGAMDFESAFENYDAASRMRR